MLETFTTGEVFLQCGWPFEGAALAKQGQGRWLNLIDRLHAIRGTIWIVRIAKNQSRLHKELHGIVANRFAGCVSLRGAGAEKSDPAKINVMRGL